MNASTLLDFFNHLGKNPAGASEGSGGAAGSSNGGRFNGLDRVSVKEEPLSEEDLRALQKDRQKKDNHNMSKRFEAQCPRFWGSVLFFVPVSRAKRELTSILETAAYTIRMAIIVAQKIYSLIKTYFFTILNQFSVICQKYSKLW